MGSRAIKSELAHLLDLSVEARKVGNEALAKMLTDEAAKCLMQIADVDSSRCEDSVEQR